MGMELTKPQQKVLSYVQGFMDSEGYAPSRAEIAKHFKWKSAAAAQDHLTKLQNRGAIKLIPNIARGIVIL